MKVPVLAGALRAIQRRTQSVWARDRAPLHGLAALGNRTGRIAVLAGRGVLAHRLGLQASGITYYTVFAIVPLLVVLLWSLKIVHHLPAISPELPANVRVPTGNQLLQVALGQVLHAVDRTSEVTSGIVGLVVLLFTVSKLFGYTERALNIISGSGQRTPKLWRLLGYVALLLVPPTVLAISGVVVALMRGAQASGVTPVLGSIPGLELVLAVVLCLGALWLGVTLLYLAAARAQLPFSSAAVGGALAAVALMVVFWVFASLQIGVSQASTLSSGLLAIPVFMLWVFSSWYAVLIGAEIAVAHHMDEVLVHGAVTFRLDGAGERQAGISIMVRLTELASAGDGVGVTTDDLARRLRLPPQIVRELCFRLVDRGLLATRPPGFALDCDPVRTTSGKVADAIDRDPALHGEQWKAPPDGASLQELARGPQNDPPPAALKATP